MPSRCIVAGCSNTTKDAVSLHRFPSDPKYRWIWTAAVNHTWAKWSEPTEHLMVCSVHFEPTYFYRGLYHHFDLTIKQMLLSDAIPTIFPLSKKAKIPQKKRGAFEKQERIRLSLSRIVLTWTWSCHGWRNTVVCTLSLRVHCYCRNVVIVNTTCYYVGAHSPTKYGVNFYHFRILWLKFVFIYVIHKENSENRGL